MSLGPPRVALFTDSFHEVNGVALTSRQLDAFARRRGLPFFSAHAGPATRLVQDGSVTTYELRRGLFSFSVEKDLATDPAFMRYLGRTERALREFRPDLIHITGPNDVGLLAALAAKRMKVPMTASWHTNVHEYAAWRLEKILTPLPLHWRKGASAWADRELLGIFTKLYGAAKACFAPNPELIAMLEQRTGKTVHLMRRGVEIELFHPDKRSRTDGVFELGYVGRISSEKNVRFLDRLEKGLLARGKPNFRIVVVGHGGEQAWLESQLSHGSFPGVLKGEALARAFANFDLFVFPSFTDTYGNVINEAMACGTPCVVTTGGGPKYLIKDGETGVVARDEEHFIQTVAELMDDPSRHRAMRLASREHAVENSWDRVFERLFEQYALVVEQYPSPLREPAQALGAAVRQ
ncbi:MAG: glycosyltransferase [Acidobacteria bacterium]|nr:glycosyltransferase [Acidobacteriota bacterium]